MKKPKKKLKLETMVEEVIGQVETMQDYLDLMAENMRGWQRIMVLCAMEDAKARLTAASAPAELVKQLDEVISRTELDDTSDDYYNVSRRLQEDIGKFFGVRPSQPVN